MAVRRVTVEVEPGQDVSLARALELVRDEAHGRDDPGDPVDEVIVSPDIERPADPPESHFFDPRDSAADPRIVLERQFEDGREVFRLREPIGYWDDEVGTVIVPDNLREFETDLTSVLRFFTWLVSTTGVHLPAALVHDALTPDSMHGATYVAGREIDRETADRIFRDSMGRLGTSLLQRWLIWSAVATATMIKAPRGAAWRSWLAVVATVGTVLVLGAMATVDVVDCRSWLPWMGDRSLWVEVVSGAVFAFVIPVALSVLWGRLWRAGAVIGAALALLLHVTLALALVYGVFAALEAAGEGQLDRAVRWTGAVLGGVLAIVLFATWAC